MRVALVSRELQPFYGGGIASYVPNMARALLASGHEVHIITETYPDLQTRGPDAIPGATFHTPAMQRGRAAREAYPTYTMRYSMATWELLEELVGGRTTPRTVGTFDYIEFPDYHAEGYWTIRAKRTGLASPALARAVLAVRLHSPLWLCRDADQDNAIDLDLALVTHCELAALAESDAIIAPSRAVLKRELDQDARGSVKRGPHRPRQLVLPLPIDMPRIARDLGADEAPPPPRDPATPPTVLFFGKFQFLKGPQDLVHAALALLRQGVSARFHLVGNDSNSGPYARSLMEYLRDKRVPASLRSRFTFENGKPRHKLGELIRAADVCCVPSRWEAFPMVCLESMALGKCVVASDAGGIPEIIEDGVSGLLYPAGDPDALARRLRQALDDEALRTRLGDAARQRVAHLTKPAEIVAAVESLVADLRRDSIHLHNAPAGAGPPTLDAPVGEPAVTVVIPYFNMHRFLPATLDTLRAQTFTNFEILVVNDGSTDPAALDYAAQLQRDPGTWPPGFKGLRVIHQFNAGLGGARNAGFAAARARWVLTLDADDLLDPRFLELAAASAAKDPDLAYVSCLASYFVETPGDRPGGWVPLGLDRDLLPVMNTGGCSGSLFRKDAVIDAGGYDTWPTSYEDWDLWCALAERGHRGLILPEFLFHYRVRPDSMFRQESVGRDLPMRAYVINRHPALAADWSRSIRIMLGESALHQAQAARLRNDLARLTAERNGHPDPAAQEHLHDHAGADLSYLVHVRAQQILSENIRYRLADKVNNALKRVGLQATIKELALRVRRKR